MRRLAPFVLFSLLLHVALIFVLRLPTNIPSTPAPHPLTVFFDELPSIERAPIPNNTPSTKQSNPTRFLTASDTPTAQLAEQPDITHSQDKSSETNPQQMMESAIDIARNEARISEQQQAAQEQKKRATPAALLDQYLQQPHKEIRLASGMLKIVTDGGEVCFQPVPYFARDMSGLFGIPMTCP